MLLEVRELSKVYESGTSRFSAVGSVNFSVDRSELVSIIGRSGSGKSTLLNMITGLIKPTAGEVLLNGKRVHSLNDKEGSFYRNSQIGYVPQGQSILSNFSVIDNVRLPFFLSKREGDPSEKAFSLLEQVGILHLAHRQPSQLSGGELKRVVIARALINSPALLIADEPTSDLDHQTTKEILELLSSFSKMETAVLAVTHEADVTNYCNRTLLMEAGKLIEKK